jgi:hypothetical protein
LLPSTGADDVDATELDSVGALDLGGVDMNLNPHPSLPNLSLNLLLLRATGCKVEGSRGVRLVVEVVVDLLLAVVRVACSEVAYGTIIFCHNIVLRNILAPCDASSH